MFVKDIRHAEKELDKTELSMEMFQMCTFSCICLFVIVLGSSFFFAFGLRQLDFVAFECAQPKAIH